MREKQKERKGKEKEKDNKESERDSIVGKNMQKNREKSYNLRCLINY
jgi:hypothetical protein